MPTRRPHARRLPGRPPTGGTWQVAGGRAEVRAVPGTAHEWTLALDGVAQSHVDLADPTHLVFEYVRWIAAAVDAAAPPGPLAAVHIGAGAGTLARWVAATRPGSHQVVLDPDEALLAVVRDQLGLRSGPGLRVRPVDGRDGLQPLADGGWDVVIRDAFQVTAVPQRLASVEFVTEVARLLGEGGIYLANLSDRAPFPALSAEVATVSAVLPRVAAITEPGVLRGRRTGNVVIVASRRDLTGAWQQLSRVTAAQPQAARVLSGTELWSRLTRPDPYRDTGPAPHSPALPEWS